MGKPTDRPEVTIYYLEDEEMDRDNFSRIISGDDMPDKIELLERPPESYTTCDILVISESLSIAAAEKEIDRAKTDNPDCFIVLVSGRNDLHKVINSYQMGNRLMGILFKGDEKFGPALKSKLSQLVKLARFLKEK